MKPKAISEDQPAFTTKWQPLDLDAVIQSQLCAVEQRAEAAAIEKLELRRELRRIGR